MTPPRNSSARLLDDVPPEEPNALVQFVDAMTNEERTVIERLRELDEAYGNEPTPRRKP